MATTFRAGTPAELGSLDPDQFLTWVIERAGLAVGYLVLTYGAAQQQARSAYVAGLYIEPAARGRGIGAKALQLRATSAEPWGSGSIPRASTARTSGSASGRSLRRGPERHDRHPDI